ncbi:MAG TPA: hypothetical protein VKT70_01570 [Stellaceae bacterium]|nr:hypothetical protein [Stellaceae bacterium]
MKIRADENVSPRIVHAVRSLVLQPGWELTHVREFHSARTADETWMPRFSQEGGNAILSADRRILTRPHQLAAIAQGGLIGIFLSPQWAESRRNEQAAQILHWWPRIEETLLNSKPRDCWKVPHGYGNGDLEKISINYAAAQAANKGP